MLFRSKMIDLPVGFPKYCNDLKQVMESTFNVDDEFIDYCNCVRKDTGEYPKGENLKHIFKAECVKRLPGYPKQDNEHNALDDARWNKKFFNFLQNV